MTLRVAYFLAFGVVALGCGGVDPVLSLAAVDSAQVVVPTGHGEVGSRLVALDADGARLWERAIEATYVSAAWPGVIRVSDETTFSYVSATTGEQLWPSAPLPEHHDSVIDWMPLVGPDGSWRDVTPRGAVIARQGQGVRVDDESSEVAHVVAASERAVVLHSRLTGLARVVPGPPTPPRTLPLSAYSWSATPHAVWERGDELRRVPVDPALEPQVVDLPPAAAERVGSAGVALALGSPPLECVVLGAEDAAFAIRAENGGVAAAVALPRLALLPDRKVASSRSSVRHPRGYHLVALGDDERGVTIAALDAETLVPNHALVGVHGGLVVSTQTEDVLLHGRGPRAQATVLDRDTGRPIRNYHLGTIHMVAEADGVLWLSDGRRVSRLDPSTGQVSKVWGRGRLPIEEGPAPDLVHDVPWEDLLAPKGPTRGGRPSAEAPRPGPAWP